MSEGVGDDVDEIYSSFLVRLWQRPGREPRIEVERVQTGERFGATSLAVISAWISARSGERRHRATAAEEAGS